MLNYTNELALPNISNFTKHRKGEVHDGGVRVGGRSNLPLGVIALGEETELRIIKHKKNNKEKKTMK